jgi:nucleoid-associated protein YgaU
MANRISSKSRYTKSTTYYRVVYNDREFVREELLIGNRFTPRMLTKRTHRVSEGETLFMIAQRYYNDQSRWFAILDANPLLEPTELLTGTELFIP